MRFLPVGIKLRGKRVLLVGGGQVASRKGKKVLAAGGHLAVLSPELSKPLLDLYLKGCLGWIPTEFREDLPLAPHLVIAATPHREVNARVWAHFKSKGALVNTVDDPEKCDFIFSAITRFPEFTVAVTTQGSHPGVAARIRGFLEDHREELEREVLKGKRPEGKGRDPGKVILVGAGPGSWDLLTVRALTEIKKADVIIKDYLIPEEVVRNSGTGARVVNLSRHRPGDRAAGEERQNYINELMAGLAMEGKRVVRLKCGDPFVFGRGGEEVSYLVERGIPVEVVPGITAGIGAAASFLIPLTLREVSSSVIFITGSLARGSPLSGGEALPFSPGTTVVAYMSSRNALPLRRRLLEGGFPPHTPVAIVERATWEGERVYFTSLDEFPEVARDTKGPSLLVVGETVNHSRRFLQLIHHPAREEERKEAREPAYPVIPGEE